MIKAALPYAILFAVGVTGAFGDILINRWAKSNGIGWLISSYVMWIVSVTLLGYFLRWERFTFSAAIFIAFVVHAMIAVVFDLLYFGGRLSKTEWIGIVFAAVALFLLEVGRESTSDRDLHVATSSDERR